MERELMDQDDGGLLTGAHEFTLALSDGSNAIIIQTNVGQVDI
jgi:hypothetical protein